MKGRVFFWPLSGLSSSSSSSSFFSVTGWRNRKGGSPLPPPPQGQAEEEEEKMCCSRNAERRGGGEEREREENPLLDGWCTFKKDSITFTDRKERCTLYSCCLTFLFSFPSLDGPCRKGPSHSFLPVDHSDKFTKMHAVKNEPKESIKIHSCHLMHPSTVLVIVKAQLNIFLFLI